MTLMLEHFDPDDKVEGFPQLADRTGVDRFGRDKANELERHGGRSLGVKSAQGRR